MQKREIAINLPQTLDPVYSNRIQVAYKDDEFSFVFLHEIAGTNQARAKAIVSITPRHAKNFAAVLTKSVLDYEAKFGEISMPVPSKADEEGSNVTIQGYV
jgi:hypothetical protein